MSPPGKKGYCIGCVGLLRPPSNIGCFLQSHGYYTCLVHIKYSTLFIGYHSSVWLCIYTCACGTRANTGQTDYELLADNIYGRNLSWLSAMLTDVFGGNIYCRSQPNHSSGGSRGRRESRVPPPPSTQTHSQ